MNADLDGLAAAMLNNQLPAMWAKVSYPSLKPLSSYIAELLERLAFFQTWLDEGNPTIYQMPYFFFVQAFMTGVLQNFARKYTIPIDTIEFDFEYQRNAGREPKMERTPMASSLRGAAWMTTMTACSSSGVASQNLFANMVYVLLKPSPGDQLAEFPHYECPCYRTTGRRGVLATTGPRATSCSCASQRRRRRTGSRAAPRSSTRCPTK